jgi:hypothetical protein
MEPIFLRYVEISAFVLAAVGAILFGWKQYQINKRTQELADYVAISIVPHPNFMLQVMNVGRSNLYLHKWEIGFMNNTYVRPILLPTEARSKINITIQPPQIGQHLAKFYLVDEKNQKYISTGEVVVEPVAFQVQGGMAPVPMADNMPAPNPDINQPNINIQLKMRAWSYKTEKSEWTI